MSGYVVVLGAAGSMGARYCAIFRSLGVPVVPVDTAHGPLPAKELLDTIIALARGVVIATPTPTHPVWLEEFASMGTPILCEKPIATDATRVAKLLGLITSPFAMMCQYQLLDPQGPFSHHDLATEYDYFRSGRDGLAWDCISLLALARGPVRLRNESPVWRCVLNGRVLSLYDVERAYVDFVTRWLKEPELQDRAWLVRAHEKAEAWRP